MIWLLLLILLLPSSLWANSLIIDNQNGTIIDGQTFTNPNEDILASGQGNCLTITNSTNITVRNSTFINCKGVAIVTGSSSGLTIENNYFERIRTAIYVTATAGGNIVINNNRSKNQTGPVSRGQFVQFNGVSGAGIRITNNTAIHDGSIGDPCCAEDMINIFNSSGAVGDYMLIENNYLEGNSSLNRGSSACGIVLGDFGGQYIRVQKNFVINAGNCGIGVAGGSFIEVNQNVIFGERSSNSNVGLPIYAATVPCSDITAKENIIWFIHKDGFLNATYVPADCGTVIGINDGGGQTNNLRGKITFNSQYR